MVAIQYFMHLVCVFSLKKKTNKPQNNSLMWEFYYGGRLQLEPDGSNYPCESLISSYVAKLQNPKDALCLGWLLKSTETTIIVLV